MPDIIKASFLFGVITNYLGLPLQIAALLLILLPVGNEVLTMLRCAGIVLAMLLGPICIGACTMKYSFIVTAYDTRKFGDNKFAARCAAMFQSLNTRLNAAYEEFWTTDNRIACGLLASLTTAFAFSEVHTSFGKEWATILIKLSVAITFIVVTILAINSSLKKANN